MGTVYLARDPLLERTLAVKVLSVDSDNQELRERFAREARSAAALRHRNIVTIFDIGEQEGRPFIAMEYVNGESVAEMIRRRAPLTLARKLQLIQELYAGLAYAHRTGLVHRDIKPSNLMVTAEGELKILDFGLARLAGALESGLTKSGLLVGTPNYMSPEQIEGQVIDQRSDIFSAGIVMYELLTYQKAFSAENAMLVLHKITSTKALSLREQIPDVDSELERIVTTATQRSPDERYRDAGLVLRDLQRLKTPSDDGVSTETSIKRSHPVEPGPVMPRPGGRSASALTRVPVVRQILERRRARQVDDHLTAAQKHFDAAEFAEAALRCEQALLLDPHEPRATELYSRLRDAIDEAQIAESLDRARHALSRGEVTAANVLLDGVLGRRSGHPQALELKREATRLEVESSENAEREAAVRRALDLATVQFAEGAFKAALSSTAEALAHDPNHDAALALKQTVNAALAAQQERESPGDEAGSLSEHTILAPAPSIPTSKPEPHDSTMFIPARPPGGHQTTGRPSVRVTVRQCADASIVDRSFAVGDRFEIGRTDDVDLRADDLTWSRRHASIEYTDRGYVIRDLGSTGGTYVNGRRVSAGATEPLFFGAQIAVGSSILTFSPASDTKLPDLSGLVVADRYLLERLLRTSSKGAVYSARQQTLPVRHAVKLLSPALLDYPGYRERFRREAEVAVDLHHPHICDVQDYGETTVTRPGQPPIKTAYLCLRLMAGGTLSDHLDARMTIPLADVARWVGNLADALAYAHQRNVVHGDIKPAAVVFDDADTANPYLTDFAIGQPREGDSSPGVIGTPAYMAPEQWEGAPSTPATDQFGLAALAYYMVTGVRPFEGQDNPEIRRRNFEHGPLPADREARRHNRDGVRSEVSRVLARGLAPSPDERYPDLRDFSKDLIGALTGTISDRDPDAKPRVFLSYRRAGGAGLPLLIVSQLDRQGIEVFLDVQRIDGAVKFPERLTSEMQRADVFVCLLGPGTLESRWVQHEVQLASKLRKPMIPVFHEEYVVPDNSGSVEVDELLSFDGIRLMDQQNLYVEEGIEKIAKRVKETHARHRRV
jgi:serine/threonine protein kinase